ncbi:CBS domain-containing protein [Rhodococcus sp. BE178]|uniref:CBS domain-containing protein n=1 Tax=Rhodococcus sp. BE178 TaxID=2817737 RepID=UPI003D1CD784
MRAGDIMTSRIVAVGEHSTLAQAVRLLAGTPDTSLPVVDASGHLVGLVTATDVLERIRNLLESSDIGEAVGGSVTDAMATPVLAMTADTDIEHVAAALGEPGTCAVPVVRGFTPIGMITRLELVRALAHRETGPAPPRRTP